MSFGDEYEGGSGRGRGGRGGTGRTRTRLPEHEAADEYGDGFGDGFGGPARRPPRTSRSLVTVVGVVVLLIAAIAFANRSGDGDTDGGGTAKAPREGAAPTAATGTKPVTGKNGTIPAGFAQDEQGAQSAAANYAVALGSAEMFDKAKRDEILSTVIAPSRLQHYQSTLDRAYTPSFYENVGLKPDGTVPEGFSFISRTVPIGTKIISLNGSRATVEVWCAGLFGLAGEGSTKPVTNGWYTITMELQWADSDWRTVNYSQKEGPAPVGGDTRASSAEEISDAVTGFGGFTYAR
ncbi:hypothetical protein [Streptomyces thermolilacinus]|uniref:Uncharacterized protein n=1 Tax=Streptomyces thermolilacinus SPC6 TaxID=1306406 RepID=A0A1D3DSF3_9ACTN|nr:hypothetical protein [Streptomyces thermolilacinus]OEJ95259.1 hypothetical protein J116_012960 [Streptomyces thermolilacinus SPC6]